MFSRTTGDQVGIALSDYVIKDSKLFIDRTIASCSFGRKRVPRTKTFSLVWFFFRTTTFTRRLRRSSDFKRLRPSMRTANRLQLYGVVNDTIPSARFTVTVFKTRSDARMALSYITTKKKKNCSLKTFNDWTCEFRTKPIYLPFLRKIL